MFKKYLPVAIVAILVYVGYDMWKREKAKKLVASASAPATVVVPA